MLTSIIKRLMVGCGPTRPKPENTGSSRGRTRNPRLKQASDRNFIALYFTLINRNIEYCVDQYCCDIKIC